VKAHALMESDRAVEGEAPARKAVELKPDAAQLRLLLAQDLLSENDHAKVADAVVTLNRALAVEPDDPMSWQYLSQAYDAKGDEGMARLAAAEEDFHLGQMKDARAFAMRAREFLKRGTPEWNRATDIVLTSNPSADDLRMLGTQG
jgi:predicted Zn-dependent protease